MQNHSDRIAPLVGLVDDRAAERNVVGELGDSREPNFLQLDVRAQYTWTWDLWQLSLYLDVQNVTNHTNEEFHVYDYRFREQGSIQGIPILPIFGLKGTF